MPELPDITVYIEALEARIVGHAVTGVKIVNPFVLRSVEPPIQRLVGLRVTEIRRMGKRIVIGFEGDLWLVIHLMIAGRLRWRAPGRQRKASTTRAHRVSAGRVDPDRGREADGVRRCTWSKARRTSPSSIAVDSRYSTRLARSLQSRLRSENHTIKRSLTDPTLFSGIGNAYSDEILHRAKLSPLLLSSRITDEQIDQLHRAVREVLTRVDREASR